MLLEKTKFFSYFASAKDAEGKQNDYLEKKSKMNNVFNISLISAMLLVVMSSCQTQKGPEDQRFETSVIKELPFRIDSLQMIDGTDVATFRFANQEYVSMQPDAIISPDGALHVYKTFILEPPTRQKAGDIWRNVVVSRKNLRIICVDRYLKEGKTQGFVYVLQSESKKYPTFGRYHWDVSDTHNIEMVGTNLQNLRELTMKRIKGGGRYEAPASQDDYWTLMFHADSLFDDHLYADAKEIYDLAFTYDRYILPSQLSTVANKMLAVGNDQAALEYLNHRAQMEKDFYLEPSACPFPQLRDTFEVRKQTWNYNLPLKEELEEILERDNYNRILWNQAANNRSESPERIEKLARYALGTDSLNLIKVNKVLSEGGFPRKSQVGEFATFAVCMVFQHNSLEQQKIFLPQLEEAVRSGDVASAFWALLKDRIDVREGRPQKYGTQIGPDGKLCPLLDASRVNEWRQEVGLPLLELSH